jgi:hypothetical protein
MRKKRILVNLLKDQDQNANVKQSDILKYLL